MLAVMGTGLAAVSASITVLAIAPLMIPLMTLSRYLRSFSKDEPHDPNRRQK